MFLLHCIILPYSWDTMDAERGPIVMKYQTLGQTQIRASRICLGGMSFGKHIDDFYQWTLDERETCDMIAHALDLGVNFIDTANGFMM